MIRLTGNDSLALHFWHRLGMWFIIAFVIAHVYTAIREDIMSRQSVISVMMLAEIVLIGVQPECLDDYGGSLTPQVKAQLMPAVYLAQEVLAQWGITASSTALPTERLNHYSLCMERYEDERPDAQSACRVGDIRVLQREKS